MLEIKTQIEEKIKDSFDLFSLPLKSQFRYFQFSGISDGSLLAPNFNQADIRGRSLVIKSIKIIPYYSANAASFQDFYLTDGVTTNEELLPQRCRVNRIFDQYTLGCFLSILINGSRLQMFPEGVPLGVNDAAGNCSIDLDLDNIFFKYNAKIDSFNVSLDAQIFIDLVNGVTDNPFVKVFVGCYLI